MVSCAGQSLPLWECGLKCWTKRRGPGRSGSLPLWECGLKFRFSSAYPSTAWVTPLVGVWIEIIRLSQQGAAKVSLPLWECGLKYWQNDVLRLHQLSLPLWECGLKWTSKIRNLFPYCHSPCGSVDWNHFSHLVSGSCDRGHSPCGSVDWNDRRKRKNNQRYSHSPCGSVDWNTYNNQSIY